MLLLSEPGIRPQERDMLFVASFVKVPAAGRREDTNTATYSSMLAQGLQYGRRI